ncbi:hypothetical protein [Ruegeria sp. A3M17]|uniref:hypothetical protein n=1 Tax=Ruegeria sp. A3M17 TaxID=2267229 RepID=UPI001F26BF81|nr:hypothetical protein [Ruegeria sp. A3M17]
MSVEFEHINHPLGAAAGFTHANFGKVELLEAFRVFHDKPPDTIEPVSGENTKSHSGWSLKTPSRPSVSKIQVLRIRGREIVVLVFRKQRLGYDLSNALRVNNDALGSRQKPTGEPAIEKTCCVHIVFDLEFRPAC